MAPKLKNGHVVKKKKLAPRPSDSKCAPVSFVASASTQPNVGWVGASPVYGVTQLSPQAYVPVSSCPALSGRRPIYDYFADLPQEVLLDIFIRLPLKSIGRSRCVSKPWLSLLTSYEFIKIHLAHHTHLAQEQKLILFSESSRPSLFSLTMHLGGNHLRELKFFGEKVYTLLGSCNGLVLVSTRGGVVWLINCMTQEYVKVPVSSFPLCHQHLSFKKYGFGYDEVSDDYKIVKISQCDYGQFGEGRDCPEIFVDIYSLKMRSWKRLETPLYGHDLLNHDGCVLINGAVHWIGLKFTSAVIGAFDLRDEKFVEFPAPASVNDEMNIFSAKLMVIDGCLGIVAPPYGGHRKTEIWLMKSYSLVYSWTKLVIDFKPLCTHQDKILFYGRWPQHLKWYSLKDGRVEVCLAADDKRFEEGITYSKSLVSPHFNYQN